MAAARRRTDQSDGSLDIDALSPEQLAENLRRWAVDEMRFRPQGRYVNAPLPTADDFKTLCRGPMNDVWKFIIEHIKSAENCKKIKGNVKLHKLLHKQSSNTSSKGDRSTREKLEAEHTQVNREMVELRSKIMNMHKEIKQLEVDILRTVIYSKHTAYSDICEEISSLNQKSALLSAYSQQCRNIGAAYQELTNQIQGRVDVYQDIQRKASQEPTYYEVQHHIDQPIVSNLLSGTSGRSTPLGLESACTRAVRETCDAIKAYLKQVYEEEFDDDIEQSKPIKDPKSKDQLWTEVEMILAQHPPWKILSSLIVTSQDTANELRDLTSRINLKRDAEELKFLYEKGGKLTDKSTPPTLFQSVHQLIEEEQALHFQRFLAAEKAMNEAWKGRSKLKSLNHEMENRLSSRYRGMPGSNDLARALYQCELEVAASQASLEYLHRAASRLTQALRERKSALETVRSKHRQIQDFEKLAQSKQSVIQALVKQNSIAQEKLEQLKLELQHYVQDKVSPHQAHIQAIAGHLSNGVYQEVDRFTCLPLNRLIYTDSHSDQRVPVDELSIYRLDRVRDRPGGAGVSALLDKLAFPLYKAPEELLPKAIEVTQEIEDTAALVQRKQRDLNEVGGATADRAVNHLNSLRNEVTHQDRVALDQLLPRVNESLAKATRALSDCINTKDSANSWWEQPAQFAVPWNQVDGMNMRQWHDQWTLNTTRLRQLQMSQQT
ncbi:AUGMIN subunit 5 [Nematostella vectensis]|uniref:AUGMIN subunit 5 n=1 Tax=Nematostella vectensis TaxID=45351 RepID=UPI0020771B6F|nr:AUGMIN subunit 5 [Nematostella vectensis]